MIQRPQCKMSSIYEACPLGPGDDTARAVRILPSTSADNTDVISCQLEVMDYTRESYQALSYVWGDPSTERVILVDDTPLKVRNNLWHFLSQAREEKHETLLWIDAICINQGDLQERNKQVAIMGRIYGHAKEVRAWLGIGTEVASAAMQKIAEINWRSAWEEVRGKERLDSYNAFRAIAKQIQGPIPRLKVPHEVLTQISVLLSLDYWSRLWIVQEYILALDLKIQCGPHVIDAKSLELVIKIVRYIAAVCPDVVAPTRRKLWFRPRNRLIEAIKALHMAPGIKIVRWRMKIEKRHSGEPMSRRPTFADLVGEFSTSQCADPHDSVYALLALDDRTARAIAPKYEESVLQLFLKVTEYFHRNKGESFGYEEGILRSNVKALQKKLGLSDECPEVKKRMEWFPEDPIFTGLSQMPSLYSF